MSMSALFPLSQPGGDNTFKDMSVGDDIGDRSSNDDQVSSPSLSPSSGSSYSSRRVRLGFGLCWRSSFLATSSQRACEHERKFRDVESRCYLLGT